MNFIKYKAVLKMSIRLFFILGLGMASANSFAQDYYHGIGLQYSTGVYKLDYRSPSVDYSGVAVAGVPGGFYKATIGFGGKLAFSSYPFLGMNIGGSSRTGLGSGSLGFELPLNAELFFGEMDDEAFFIGAGYNSAFLASTSSGGGKIAGPQLAIGGQFYVWDALYGVRLAYTYGLNDVTLDDNEAVVSKDQKSLFSIGVYLFLDR